MRDKVMKWLLVASVTTAALACEGRDAKPSIRDESPPPKDDVSAQIQRAEQQAAERDAERACERPIKVYGGSIMVNASDYIHPVKRGTDYVEEPIAGLDRVLSKGAQVRFTLDYPFERPFAGVVTSPITLRRTIDAIRAGFRKMYEGTTQRDIPGMLNKDVTGPYGQAVHAIDDLVIERINLCADDTLLIDIGS